MLFNIGDLVTRNSYNNDIVFKIVDIDNDIALLEGINFRLSADSNISDLKNENKVESGDNDLLTRFGNNNLDRNDYFYLPGKILHIDGDKDYLNRCMKFYNKIKKINHSRNSIN